MFYTSPKNSFFPETWALKNSDAKGAFFAGGLARPPGYGMPDCKPLLISLLARNSAVFLFKLQ